MSKGKMLAFAVILSFVGASNAFARKQCYFVKAQLGQVLKLDIRYKNDLSAPVDTLKGVLKFRLYGEENDTKLLRVKTVRSITGGAPATAGWVEKKFRDGRAPNCYPAYALRRDER